MSEGFGQYEFERHRKPKAPAPHPSSSRNVIRRKLAPPLPPVSSSSHPGAINGRQPNLPLKTLQGLKTRRTDSTKAGYGREVVLVTRKSGLGTLIGRCRSLVLDEGYTTLTLHALSAAIPHALLLLHALLDILPYPKGSGGMWYEIKTGSVECVDEVSTLPDLSNPTGLEGEEEFPGVGAIEEDEPERVSRIKSSIQIQLHIGPRKSHPIQNDDTLRPFKARNRPSKHRRQVLASRRKRLEDETEETAMNSAKPLVVMDEDEVEEPLEG
ncbi:hypothetical protein M231_07801 [Tremella mesenterica]|uniref:Uncharacterized protein n=1 Tax=Tremella mesenterica TaxID=5217 RepID=A0A4V1M2X9_TREME|nr:hypothetical protein M231_07801 [Tremella mesenterica]